MRSSSRPRCHSRSRSRDRKSYRRRRRSRSRSRPNSPIRRRKSPTASPSRSRHRPNSTQYTKRQHGKDWNDTELFEERKRKRDSLQFSIWSTIPSPSPSKWQNSGKHSSLPRKRRSVSLTSASSITSTDEYKHKKERKNLHKIVRESKSNANTKRKTKKSVRESKRKSKRKKEKKKTSKKKRKIERRSPSSSDINESGNESPEVDGFEEAELNKSAQNAREKEEEHQVIGPQPLQESNESSSNSLSYGKALLPGEGAAIAQFVQKNMRIPRRGEVGWNGQEIEQLEDLGYVMSGSRHKKMNAVRIRKENQVYTAEEKRALALINFEEKQQREHAIMSQFRDMLTERLTKKHGAQVVENAENCKI
ncbi:hypothetical protein ABG067_001694 [Albugo candida]